MGIVEAPLAVLAKRPLRAEHAIRARPEPHQPVSLHGLALSRSRAVCQAFVALPGPSLLDRAQVALAAWRDRPRKSTGRINGENGCIKRSRHNGLGGRQGLDYQLVLGETVGHWGRHRGGWAGDRRC
ncbi:hypothetical protein QR685DRAFT_436510 [Neurospora intermedia]|uniref:Transposase n=1 Tax=Neurospora intermedia TaxID=5142 RepID=A0ABR3DJJ7_NEUIN